LITHGVYVARTKLKKKRDIHDCKNWMRLKKNFLEVRGISSKSYYLNQDNFDSEDYDYEIYEHGISKRSYKVNGDADYMNHFDYKLNKGKKRKRRVGRRISHGLTHREIQRIMEEL
jgi:hypothetical protein